MNMTYKIHIFESKRHIPVCFLFIQYIPWRRAWQPPPVFLPGESPWTEEPGGVQSMGLQKVGHD